MGGLLCSCLDEVTEKELLWCRVQPMWALGMRIGWPAGSLCWGLCDANLNVKTMSIHQLLQYRYM